MKFKTNPLRDAITLAIAISAFAGMGAALAQDTDTPDQKAVTLDRMQVTGSRIRQVDLETAQPVFTITREDIENQGFQSVAEILQSITSTGTPPLSRASPLSAGENAGGTFISLRNLGAARTLVLLNGKRLGVSTSGLSDISTIPTSAVHRIEVLKDGASSIYGSDAIAGVINIITRSNFDGMTASAFRGQYSEGDGETTRGDMVMGFTGDRGSLTTGAEWVEEKGVSAADRPYSAFPRSHLHPTLGWTTVSQHGGFVTTASTPVPGVPTGRRVILREGGDPRKLSDYRAQDTDSNSVLDKSNTNLQTDLRTPQERKALFLDGIYELTDDIRFRTNLLYSNRDSERTVAGYPMQAASFATPMSATSYFNPTGATISNWFRRTWEIPRVSSSELTTYRFTGGFDGSIDAFGRYFDWDVGYMHNTNKLLQSTYGNLNLARTRLAVGPSFLNAQGQVQCGTAAAPVAFTNCVPFNPFLPFGREGQGGLTNNQQLVDYLFQEEHATGETKTQIYTANVASTLFTLPAGDIGYAVGVESRKESGGFTPDALAVTGNSTNLSAGPTRGGYKVDEVYAELEIPLLADVMFAQELGLSLASRYSDYDTFGDTTNDKAGFKWKPIKSVLVRGTWAEGFRAPTIADLFGGSSDTFSFYTDPCDTVFGASKDASSATRARCVAEMGPSANTFRQLGQGFTPTTTASSQTPVAFKSGSNPLLQPETAESRTLGLVWSPGFIQDLNLALDWWNIRVENTIVGDSPNQILGDCYNEGITTRCNAALFTRDPSLGYVNFMAFGSRNAGFRDTEGYDFDVSYKLPSTPVGDFSLAWNTTYTSKDQFLTTNDPAATHPTQLVSFGSSFRVRSNMNLGWSQGAWSANWMARYFSKIKESCLGATTFPDECSDPDFRQPNIFGVSVASPINVKGSNTFHDMQVRWAAPWNATVAVGANNVFNHVGPVLYSQPSANVSYYGEFDIGRFWYMKYTQRF